MIEDENRLRVIYPEGQKEVEKISQKETESTLVEQLLALGVTTDQLAPNKVKIEVKPPSQWINVATMRQQDMEFESYKDQLNAFLMMQNVAEKIPEQMLTEIGIRVVEEYDIDFESRREWYEEMKEFIDLGSLVGKTKMWGEAVVANVKYPTLATAAIQFAACAYPNIIAGADVVKGKKQGADPDGMKQRRATRMATYMSWQLLEGMNATVGRGYGSATRDAAHRGVHVS